MEEGRHVAMQAAEIARVFAARLQFALDFGESPSRRRHARGDAALSRLGFGPAKFLSIAPFRHGFMFNHKIWYNILDISVNVFLRGYGWPLLKIASTRLGLGALRLIPHAVYRQPPGGGGYFAAAVVC